jgi:hypothetical protein
MELLREQMKRREEKRLFELVCVECGRHDPGNEPGWTLRLDIDDELAAFCPAATGGSSAMPAKQRGSVVKRGKLWQARWRDENGEQRGEGGFPSRTAARDWLDDRIDEVSALRRGDLLPTRDRPATIETLLDLFLDKHGRTVDPSTKRTLETRLRYARAEFGVRDPDSLRKIEVEDWRAELPAGHPAHVQAGARVGRRARLRDPRRDRRD